MIKIYNSLTKQIEEFKPIEENKLSMYVCGPTVYNYMHIGNSRPVVFFDVVNRFFRYLGYDVTYVSNYTDIDDKIIQKANEDNVTEADVSTRFIKEIDETYKKLNIIPHNLNPKVTENMEEIINYIKELISKGGAYVSNGDVYFDVSKVDDYGILSSQTIENLIQGSRIEVNEKKKNPIDFTLWKKTDSGLRWDSPWSAGRPGWHTECVTMIDNIFKGKIDIHGGGLDLKFPHHDNEIAQSTCMHNHKIANFWMHNGRIDMSGEKMSKSIGNVIWANDLLDQVGYGAYRFMILNVPYRQPLNYKDELLAQANDEYTRIARSFNSLYRKLELNDVDFKKNVSSSSKASNAIKAKFIDALSNDFNTANAITELINITKLANQSLRVKDLDFDLLLSIYNVFKDILYVLGLETKIEPLNKEDKDLVIKYEDARSKKNFALSDELREKIISKGIII